MKRQGQATKDKDEGRVAFQPVLLINFNRPQLALVSLWMTKCCLLAPSRLPGLGVTSHGHVPLAQRCLSMLA